MRRRPGQRTEDIRRIMFWLDDAGVQPTPRLILQYLRSPSAGRGRLDNTPTGDPSGWTDPSGRTWNWGAAGGPSLNGRDSGTYADTMAELGYVQPGVGYWRRWERVAP